MKILTILLLLYTFLFSKEVTVKQLFNVQTVKVKKTESSQTKKYYGYIKENDSNIYDVTPRFGGYIEDLKVDKRYEYVKKGALLATVYSPEVLRAKEEYLNTLKYIRKIPNKAMLESAKEKLLLLGVSAQEVDDIKIDCKVSRHTNIYAPASGYIFEKNIVKGSAFSMKQKLFTIVNLKDVWAEISIMPQDIPLIPKFTDFKVVSPVGDFKAYKENLYPMLSKKDALSILRLDVKNKDDALLPNMYVTVIAKMKQKSYLTLPSTAVIFKNKKYYVFIKGEYEGEYEPKSVDAKELNAQTYIVKGLNEGDEVVNNALFMMDSDAQINGLY
ncbi:efflux RND transporter periplasmic adaptor subunit [Sulfurimonas sp. HSL-1716]|uniref:efflux RND transporter periplasmic adaptor subunit n=1 Tax=Hydrocurvibacter sulfurireducens TaxID=3131937 RepID=UPI0031F9AA24